MMTMIMNMSLNSDRLDLEVFDDKEIREDKKNYIVIVFTITSIISIFLYVGLFIWLIGLPFVWLSHTDKLYKVLYTLLMPASFLFCITLLSI